MLLKLLLIVSFLCFGDVQGRAALSAMAPTNVFINDQLKVQEAKEAFILIDVNRDGVIQIDELKGIYGSIDKIPSELKEARHPFNFTAFLNMFAERLGGTEEDKGVLTEAYVKDLLQNMGDNFTADEIKQTWKESPISKGMFDNAAFSAKLLNKA